MRAPQVSHISTGMDWLNGTSESRVFKDTWAEVRSHTLISLGGLIHAFLDS